MYRLIFLFISFLYGIEIDLSIAQNLSKTDVKNRLILAKYYFDKNITKSNQLLEEVLKIDKNNTTAKKLLKNIKLQQEFVHKFKSVNIDEFYRKLYFNQDYKEIKVLSKYISIIKSDYPKLITAKIYFWEGNYQKTKEILKFVKNKNNLDYIEIVANLNFYEGDYQKAKNYFLILYKATYKLSYAYKLIDCYIFLNEIEKANILLDKLLKKDKNNKTLNKLKTKIDSKTKNRIEILKKKYQKTGKFEDLQKLVSVLLNLDRAEEAYSLLDEYIEKYPNDKNAIYWYASYLSWGGDNKKALKIVEKIVEEGDYKLKLLIAKIYSWSGEYQKSINYLNDIIANSENKNLILEAKEVKGLIYYWKREYKKAKPILEFVIKQKSAIEAKEALMVINGNIRPLIKKYKLLSKKEPMNLDYILRVAQFSEVIKDIDTAIEYYERYYNLKPLPKIAHSLAKLYLLKKNPYKAFSYYEYWAYQKGDKDSLYELAENYYYAGYNKSALSVINDILNIDTKYKKALILKAKILRYSPKFTQENSTKSLTDIFSEKNSKVLTIANRLYFNGFYDEASEYYKKYILDNPDDYEIRERFGYSLEFSGKYKEASGEFFLLTWQKKNCDILYHYGVSLEKSKKEKLAKKVFKEALNYAKKPLPTFLKQFINRWKKGWESQDIEKYKQFYISKYSENPIWIVRKESIFRNLKFISLYLAGFSLTEKYYENNKTFYKIRFFQQYTTDKKSDKGYKILTVECDKNQNCLIAKERWEAGEYIPTNHRCYKMVSLKLDNSNIFSMKNLLKNRKVEIVLDPSNKKSLSKEDNVFVKFKVKTYKDNNLTKHFKIIKKMKGDKQNIIEKNITSKQNNQKNRIGLKGYFYRDKEKIKLIDYGAYYKNNKIYFDISKWKLWRNKLKKEGNYFTFHYNFLNNLIAGVEIGSYENNSYFYPYIEYEDWLNIKYFHSVTGKDKKSFCGIENNLTTKHLIFSKYKGFDEKMTDFWWSVDFSKIENNLEITPQFLYLFYNDKITDIDYYLYLSGWYQTNSIKSNCYYSPSFSDSTYLEFHPTYKNLEGIFKVGYSFIGDDFLYGYGFKLNTQYLDLECLRNHSYKNSINNYWYDECFLDAKVNW